MIRALPRVLEVAPNTHYLIVGEGHYRPVLERLVDDIGVRAHVTFAGKVREEELAAYYQLCDVFVMPNREMPDGDTEGFGLVFLEANACGKPVIGGRAGGAVEAVRDGENGLLVDGWSVAEVASALSRLLTDRVLNARIAARGLESRACVQFALEGRTVLFTLRVLGSPMKTHLSGGRGTLLIVAGEFPPLKTIGRIRTAKVRRASAHAWLGGDRADARTQRVGSPNYDAALAAEVPEGVEVVRVPLVTFDDRITAFVKRLLGREVAPRSGGADGAHGRRLLGMHRGSAPSGRFESIQHRVKQWIRLGLEIPDSYLPWALKALPAAREICSRRTVDVVFTTLPPFSAAYLGYRLTGERGIPWILDYQDLWYGDVLREWLPAWRRRLEFWMERRLLSRASVVVTVSEQKTDYMRRLHPRLRVRWATLTNGYDREIYSGRARARPVLKKVVGVFVLTLAIRN
ncbi:MAG: glycosyltransferase, partial [Chromatiales bacterium]|nr:glycosyltransferase [Chromatiales bacterium]